MTTVDAFLINCRLADGRLFGIGVADGKIAIVGEGAAPAFRTSSAPRDSSPAGADRGWSSSDL